MTTTRWNVGEALRWASSVLFNESQIARQESLPVRQSILRSEAEMLLQWAADWTRSELLSRLSSPVEAKVLAQFQKGIRDRADGIPLQYLMGSAAFYGRDFQVQKGCLIPRPETEWLVESARQWVNENNPVAVVMDVGTGSGAIAVTLALECPNTQVHGIDLSGEALEIARSNAQALQAQVTFHEGDAIQLLAQASEYMNVLVSNPPYIPSKDVDELEDEVKEFEPRVALDGGADGLEFYRSLIALGEGMFAPGPAALFLEVGADQAETVVDMLEQSRNWSGWRFWTVNDLRGIQRIVAGSR